MERAAFRLRAPTAYTVKKGLRFSSSAGEGKIDNPFLQCTHNVERHLLSMRSHKYWLFLLFLPTSTEALRPHLLKHEKFKKITLFRLPSLAQLSSSGGLRCFSVRFLRRLRRSQGGLAPLPPPPPPQFSSMRAS